MITEHSNQKVPTSQHPNQREPTSLETVPVHVLRESQTCSDPVRWTPVLALQARSNSIEGPSSCARQQGVHSTAVPRASEGGACATGRADGLGFYILENYRNKSASAGGKQHLHAWVVERAMEFGEGKAEHPEQRCEMPHFEARRPRVEHQ
jgi:hypothetical protein